MPTVKEVHMLTAKIDLLMKKTDGHADSHTSTHGVVLALDSLQSLEIK